MRAQIDECSIVSLRDIQRAMNVSEWFLIKSELIFDRMKMSNFEESYQGSPQMTLI